MRKINQFAYHNSEANVCVSSDSMNRLKTFFPDEQYQVIHNGINLENFRIYPTEEVKKQYGLEGRRIILGVASIWMEEKGWNDFMQLSELLNPEEVIVLVGVKEEQKKGLPKNIVPISRTENLRQLAELYAAAEAFVNPTWQDNYPTVNLEAIACGTPVVTYRTGGSPEAIDEDTGIVVEPGDVESLARAIMELKSNPLSREDCRCRAEKYFDKDKSFMRYVELYEQLIL